MAYIGEDILREEINKIKDSLKLNNIVLQEIQVRNYNIKHNVFLNENLIGTIIWDYSSKKNTIKPRQEKQIGEDNFKLIKYLFDRRNEEVVKSNEEEAYEEEFSDLREFYEILLPYKDSNLLDFSEFASMIKNNLTYEKDKKVIDENLCDFKVLEKYYLNIINKK